MTRSRLAFLALLFFLYLPVIGFRKKPRLPRPFPLPQSDLCRISPFFCGLIPTPTGTAR